MRDNVRFGWKRDLPDHRDYQYTAHPEFLDAPPLPAHVDLEPQMSAVENQLTLGSCVLNAVAGSLEFLELKDINGGKPGPEVFDPKQFKDISRLYAYFNCRLMDGNVMQDSGTTFRTAIKAIRKWGVCKEETWPYDVKRAYTSPPQAAYLEGQAHKIMAGFRLDHLAPVALQQCLANGYPFVIGISVYESFMGAQAAAGSIPMPASYERMLGGHGICIVGYDMAKAKYKVRNSWGARWGKNGYADIDFAYLHSRYLAADAWTLRNDEAV